MSGFDYVERAFEAPLSEIATRAWYLKGPSPERYERILPLPYVYLIVNLGEPYRVLRRGDDATSLTVSGAFLVGVQPHFVVNENPALLHHVGVEIRPEALLALADRHVGHGIVPAEDLLPGADALRAALVAAPDPATALDVLGRQLSEWTRPQWSPHPVVGRALADVAQNRGRTVRDVAQGAGVAPQTLVSLFRQFVGITPKRYTEVLRLFNFVNEVAHVDPVPTWAEMAATAGYYDQPHFNRVFRRYVGTTPQQYLDAVRASAYGEGSFVPVKDQPEG